MKRILLFLFLISLTGCGVPVNFKLAPQTQVFRQNNGIFTNQLDILWVIDNSGSMGPLQSNLTSNFQSFISTFQTKGYDFHMAVTTSDAYKADPTLNGYSAANAPLSKFRDGLGSTHTGVFVILPTTPNLNSVFVTNASQGTGGSGDERAFSSFRSALSDPVNAGFLRQQSFLAVIILSDEDDFSGNGRAENGGTDHDYNASTLDPESNYVSYLDQLTLTTGYSRRYNVSSIAVLDSVCLAQHQQQSSSSIIGQRYMQIAADTRGLTGSICDTSYAATLNAIQSNIIELSTQFFLNEEPQVDTITVYVNGQLIPQDPNNGWTYDPNAVSIVFHGSAVPAQGSTIAVGFTPTKVLGS